MQPLEQEQGDQGCPNLNQQSILTGSDEGFDFQVLLEHLEKQFDLPTVLVDGRNGRGAEFQMIGQQNDLPIMLLVPDDDAPEEMGAVSLGIISLDPDELIRDDGAMEGRRKLADHLIIRIVLEPGDKENPLPGPLTEEGIIGESLVNGYYGPGVQVNSPGDIHFVPFGFSNQKVGRHIIIMIQEHMRFNASLASPKFSPRKQTQAQTNGGGVKTEQLVFKTKLGLPAPQAALFPKPGQSGPEQFFEQGGWPLLVGVGQGGLVGRTPHPEMNQFAQAAG